MGIQGSSHCHVDQMCGDWKSKSQCLSVKCYYITLTQEKCAWYWPNKLHDKHSGDKFTVTLTSTTPYVEYGMRCFEVQSVSNLCVVKKTST